MKVCHTIISIDKESGGTSTYLQLLANELVSNIDIDIVTNRSKNPLLFDKNVNIHFVENYDLFNKIYVNKIKRKLLIKDFDIFHGNGLWQYPVHRMAQFARKRNIPYILSPHGMLEPWALNSHRLKKQIGLFLFQFKDLEKATCLHATSFMEAENIRKLGFKNPIAIIPNGIDLTEFKLPGLKEANESRTLLFLSRIHPKKGIEILIEAWSLIDTSIRKSWQVKIAGNGEPQYLASLKKLIEDKGLENEILIIGAKFGKEKLSTYQQADLFVLPTYSENFGIVIAEALACGVPVITTKGTPWEELLTYNAGWWINIGVGSLVNTLNIALNLTSDELKSMGLNGHRLVEENYSIVSVSKKMLELYEYILNDTSLPAFIDINSTHDKSNQDTKVVPNSNYEGISIQHVISSIDLHSGGPSRSVTELCSELINCGIRSNITSIASDYPLIPEELIDNIHLISNNRLQLVRLKNQLNNLINQKKISLIHCHGIWQITPHIAARLARKTNLPYIISPRGMLEPWALNEGKWKKKLGLRLYQNDDLANAVCIHATSQMEARNIRNLGFKNPIAVIPNGIDMSKFPLSEQKKQKLHTLLFLSRIHPKKGIEILIEAWSNLDKNTRQNWQIKIAGNGEKGYIADLQNLISEKGLDNDIHIIGPRYRNAKILEYQQADLFVLPTYSENFGIVVAEAMACGVPVITTKGTPWEELNTQKAGWCIEIGLAPLTETLSKALLLSDNERILIGLNGRKLVEENYSIESISKKMIQLYKWVLFRGEKPEFIIL